MSTKVSTAKGAGESSILLASIFEKSSRSLTTVSSIVPAPSISSTWWRSSGLRLPVLSRSSAKPMTLLSGVRISWLITVRKLLFARMALSAASCADRNCFAQFRAGRTSSSHASAIISSAIRLVARLRAR